VKAPTAVNVGDLIDGKYRIEAKIGSGAMAIVYSARHTKLNHLVALKFLDPKLHASTEAKARFGREGRASFALRSEHVCRVLDVGVTPGGTPFIVMDLLEGSTLDQYVQDNGRLPLSRALSFAVQATEGVAAAHARGIVHRDIKPENLFVTPREVGEPLVRVLDFGISKELLGEREGSLTGTNDLIGTPAYMAPEQFAHAKTADPRADVWSLGILIYWLLTGTTPFDAPTPMGIMSAILTRKPTGASLLNPEVPRGVDDLILKCITQERAGRFENATELLRALMPHQLRRTADARDVPPSSASVTEPRMKVAPQDNVPTREEIQALEDAPTYADSGPPVTTRSAVLHISDEYPLESADLVSAGPPSGKTAVMAIPQRVSAPTQEPSSPPNSGGVPDTLRTSGLPPEPQRISSFDRTYPLAQNSPLQAAANAMRTSVPPQAPMPHQRDSRWSHVPSMPPPAPMQVQHQEKNPMVVVLIVLAVLGLGVGTTVGLRSCAKAPDSARPSSAQ